MLRALVASSWTIAREPITLCKGPNMRMGALSCLCGSIIISGETLLGLVDGRESGALGGIGGSEVLGS
jgi:hypothetical protein